LPSQKLAFDKVDLKHPYILIERNEKFIIKMIEPPLRNFALPVEALPFSPGALQVRQIDALYTCDEQRDIA
jgi:hypothetical protein